VGRLILASTSPYKSALLARLGLPFHALAPAMDEDALPGEPAAQLAARLARGKAAAVEALAEDVGIGADQVPALGDDLLRKPGSHAEALRRLSACQGRTVTF
jgi:septum formation protein